VRLSPAYRRVRKATPDLPIELVGLPMDGTCADPAYRGLIHQDPWPLRFYGKFNVCSLAPKDASQYEPTAACAVTRTRKRTSQPRRGDIAGPTSATHPKGITYRT
jgi:hypothetical protein